MKNKLFFVLLFSLVSSCLFGGVVEYNTYLQKANIISGPDVKLTIQDPLYNGGPLYTSKVSLVYGRKDLKDLATSSSWLYSVTYTLKFYNSSGILQSTYPSNTLTISNSSSPITFEAVKVFDQSSNQHMPWVSLIIDNVTCSSCSFVTDIRLELTMSKDGTGIDNLNTSTMPSLGFNAVSKTAYWSYLPGAERYELEWVYIDSLDVTSPFTNPADPFLFKEPVRIITTNQHFNFSKTYPSGTVYFRVRGVGNPSGSVSEAPKIGAWSYGGYGTGNLALCQISKGQFEYNKNWQYTTTFAEGGKYKKVLSYYDGTLRNRQALINVSTDTTVLVSETKYDYEGRGVVSILPAPLATNSLNYNVKLNQFANNKDSIQAFDNKLESLPLDSNYGTARYYSYLNNFNNSVNRDFIPNAEGYPYSQVMYTNDNTGRVAKQSGVGKAFHFNSAEPSKRYTQYFYGSPSDTELKKLFGTNIGNTKHYKKNIVLDPNGQVSIQILDQEGRMVASALGGNKPDNLNALASNVPMTSDTTSLNQSNKVDTDNSISKSVSKIQNLDPTQQYTFKYDLTGVVNNTGLTSGGSTLCKTCKYDLKITILDPDGLVANTSSQTLNPPTVTCATTSYKVNGPGLINIPFTKIGEYTIIKELTLSSGAIDSLLTSVRSSTSYPSYNSILQGYLSKVDSSACDITCEDHCLTKIRKAHPGYTQAQLDTAVANCVKGDCGAIIDSEVKEISKNDCESTKQQMLEQLMPDGYYNTQSNWLETNRSGVIFHNKDGSVRSPQPTTDTLRMSDYFESQWAEDLFLKHPEWCLYDNCIKDTLSKQFDMNMARVATWKEARISGYLNPLWMTSGEGYTFGAITKHDPFFEGTGRGTVQRTNLVNTIKAYKNESVDNVDYNASGGIGGTVSLWTYSLFLAKKSAYPSPLDSNTAWNIFHSMYSAEKQNCNIAATSCTWQPIGASFTVFQKPGAPPVTDTLTLNSSSYTILQGACKDNCEENIIVWMRMLKSKCNMTWLGTDSLKVADSLRSYCMGRCGFDNPFALLIAQDVGVNNTLKYINNTILSYYGCKLDSIATVDPCVHRTVKTTITKSVTKETIVYYDLINEIIASFSKNCTTPGSNCLPINTPIYVNQYVTYNKNRSVFDNYNNFGDLIYIKIVPFSTGQNFYINHQYQTSPNDNYTMYHFTGLTEDGINRNSIKRIFNLRVNPLLSNSQIMFDIELMDGNSTPYPLMNSFTLTSMNYILWNPTLENKVQTFSICDSISSTNSTFTYTFNTQSQRDSCIAEQTRIAVSLANEAYKDTIQNYESAFLKSHFNKCFKSPFGENFYYVSKQPPQYHYTLYYYDQSGNLVQTVPPEGVDTLGRSRFSKGNLVAGANPLHRLITKYKYNSLNQIIWQSTPDGGKTNFYYNEKGQLRLSQNSQQKKDTAYSYTKYDGQGRIVEVGQLKGGFALTYDSVFFYNSANTGTVMGWLNDFQFPSSSIYTLSQMTNTVYGFSYGAPISQQNILNRVSMTYSDNSATNATYYSYDIHGNVNKIAKNIPGLGTKIIDYEYDLISGNVTKVSFQNGQPDAFYHKYQYDADNRIVSVKTSTDGVIWDQDASYKYYKHGPLARTELGEYKVQGLDYYYTLQGWLKGINTPHFQTASGSQYVNTLDPGKDGLTNATLNKFIAQDEFQMALGYYQGDYKGISNNANLGAGSPVNTINLNNSILGQTGKKGLYNGNIAWMITDMKYMSTVGLGGTNNALSTRAMAYQYDQLNRLVRGYSYNTYSSDASGWSARSAGNNSYDFRANYDANGNISWLSRVGSSTSLIDSLSYNYNKSGNNLTNNRLRNITDIMGNAGVGDIGTQATDNYGYDDIGNLIKDTDAQISKISWSAYGKVLNITRTTGSTKDELEFKYDASGNRVIKIVKPRPGGVLSASKNWNYTYYVRDASGNVMATYTRIYNSGTNEHFYTLAETGIFGSARIGLQKPNLITKKANADNGNVTFTASLPGSLKRNLNYKNYELTDHLGNVRVTLLDQPRGFDTNADGKTDYYLANVSTFSDYGPFGDLLPTRKYSTGDYKYGFNGKESDGEWNSNVGAMYDYGFRIYDPRIAKFLSVDPLTKSYPELTPYQFASNTPIWCIDIDGLEAIPYGVNWSNTLEHAKLVKVGAAEIRRDPMGALHLALDGGGMVPVLGEPADFINGSLYTLEGDGTNAALSFGAMVPIWGWLATGSKFAARAVRTAKGGEAFLTFSKNAAGKIDFGSRKQLATILGTKGTGKQAHHIIPWEAGGNDVVQKAADQGFHLNDALNGVPLETTQHLGSHPAYNEFVTKKLNDFAEKMGDDLTPEASKNFLENELIPTLRTEIGKSEGKINEHFQKLLK